MIIHSLDADGPAIANNRIHVIVVVDIKRNLAFFYSHIDNQKIRNLNCDC